MAIARTGKGAVAAWQPQATKRVAAGFPRRGLATLPHRVHTVLTDNGIEFGNMRHQPRAFRHVVDRACAEHGIEHRFTQPPPLDHRPRRAHEPHGQRSTR